MESIALRAEVRPRGSKGSVKALRRRGMLPAVVYGKDAGNILIAMPEKDLHNILAAHSTGSTLISLEVEDRSYPVMLREVQRNPLRRTILHADFLQVSLTEVIETEIPLHLVGEAPGVKDGGILQHMLREVTVSCLPTQMPDMITADISGLKIGDQLTVGELTVPPDLKIITETDSVIVLVVPPAIEEKPAEEVEAAAAPAEGEA
ncbi:MAG: 50S ribosomal protein L25 [Thermacetogeniaceae bacterium]|jgi:large subunit ribosomal protein L25